MATREPRLWSNDAGASWSCVGWLVDANAIAQTVLAQLTGGVFLTGFALALGAHSLVIGVLAALPVAAKLSQLILSAWIERSGRWKRVALTAAAFARVLLLLVPVLALTSGDDALRLAALIVVLACSSLGACVYELAFLTWMAELIPEPLRGVFWGRRGRNAGFVGIAASIAAAATLDVQPVSSVAQPRFAIVFAAGAVIGCIGVAFLAKLPDARRKRRREELPSLADVVATPIRDEQFRIFVTFSAIWSAITGAMAPFYTVYMLQRLHLSILEVTLLTALTNLLMAVTQTYWGRLGDHFGTKPVLRIGSYLIALTPLCWLATSPDRVWPIIIAQSLSGIGWSAFHVSQSNYSLKLAPEESRPSYLGAFGAVTGLAEGLAPIVAGAALAALTDEPTPSVVVFHVMMGAQLVALAFATPIPARLRETDGTPVGHLIRVMERFRSMDASRPVALLFQYGYTHLARVADLIAREYPRDAERL